MAMKPLTTLQIANISCMAWNTMEYAIEHEFHPIGMHRCMKEYVRYEDAERWLQKHHRYQFIEITAFMARTEFKDGVARSTTEVTKLYERR